MQRRLVFIPIEAAELGAITGEVSLVDRRAHTVTPELLTALEYTVDQEEDAEYAAMVLASVAALARFGRRLVLVADLPAKRISPEVGPDEDPGNGGCRVESVAPGDITCWFSEAPDVDFADAAAAARGLDIDTAWDFPQVQELLGHDLLWNDVVEYRRG